MHNNILQLTNGDALRKVTFSQVPYIPNNGYTPADSATEDFSRSSLQKNQSSKFLNLTPEIKAHMYLKKSDSFDIDWELEMKSTQLMMHVRQLKKSSNAATRYKGKEIAKQSHLHSELASEEDSCRCPIQAQKDKDMQKKFGSHCKVVTVVQQNGYSALTARFSYDTDHNVFANTYNILKQSIMIFRMTKHTVECDDEHAALAT
ncbi:hypothetical protein Tco_1109394 [Tanacetum coccineum]